jgi:anti-anti-sigma factor
MTVDLDARVARPALAFNFELSHGRPGAAARVELHDRVVADAGRSAGVSRRARLALRGCIDLVAARRLEQVLDDLASRGVEQVLVDCVELRHIDFRVVPALVTALDRFEARSGGVVLCGLSRYMRDLFRMAGCESRLRCWPSAADLLATGAPAPEPARECAS